MLLGFFDQNIQVVELKHAAVLTRAILANSFLVGLHFSSELFPVASLKVILLISIIN